MENRRDQLEKFAYVFNYKIKELTNQIGPRQHQINALIEQFNNVRLLFTFHRTNKSLQTRDVHQG
jgi:hypothetical protein